MKKSEISIFDSPKQILSEKTITILDALNSIKNGTYKKQIDKLRNGDKSIKEKLPMIAFQGLFDGERKKNSILSFSGIIIIDIDDVEDDLEEVKEDIMSTEDSVLAAMVSPSGNGVKVLYRVDEELITIDNYRKIGKQIGSNFSLYGDIDFLSITDCLIATYDPNILINWEAKPALLYIPEDKVEEYELEERDESVELWEDPEEFFETVLLDAIEERASNNYHFIQISMLDLAKFGFTHPAYDLSFVIEKSETIFKKSDANKTRFLEVAEIARGMPQKKWAYRFDENDEDFGSCELDDAYRENAKLNDDDEINEDGFIDYSHLFDRVITTAKMGNRVGFETSLPNFNDNFRFLGSGIITITGIPGHGKTEFVDQCIVDLARLHNHSTIVCGFEQSPEEHIIKLMRKMIGTDITNPSYMMCKDNMSTFKKNFSFITDKIRHVDTTHLGGNITKILEVSATKILEMRKQGHEVKYMVIDPFNMLSIKCKMGGHEKIEEILRVITHFSHQMNILVFLVAHPFKMKKDEKTGMYEIPDFYSVKGSSAFFEMSYHGLVVYRTGYQDGSTVKVIVLKVKQNNLGKTGETALFRYHKPSGRYIPIDENDNIMKGDHSEKDWLSKVKF